MQEFDLLVLGAGPAGSAAALVAAKAGLRVGLVDRAAFPRDKLCGGGVTARAQKALERIFGGFPAVAFTACSSVRFVAGGRLLGEVADPNPIRMIMRQEFDQALRAQALAAGVTAFTGKPRVEGTALHLGDRPLRGKILIGADGANSAVARSLYSRGLDLETAFMAYEVEAPQTPSPPPVAELDFGSARWGYGWAFPKIGGLTLGLGGQQRKNPALRRDFDLWLAARGFAGLKVKGHPIPTAPRSLPPGRGAVLLAGDAAGFVDPLSGEGIAWALISGELAAQSAIAALGAACPESAAQRYDAATALLRRELASAHRLAALIYHPLLHKGFISLLGRSRGPQERFLRLVAGEVDYADYGPRRLFRILARILLHLR